jgi:hypothetical protein
MRPYLKKNPSEESADGVAKVKALSSNPVLKKKQKQLEIFWTSVFSGPSVW